MGAAQAEAVRQSRFTQSRAHAWQVEGILEGGEMVRKRHSDVEDFLEEKGREWARLMYEEHLALRAALERETDVVGADGVPRKSTRRSERQLQTVLGRVPVPRLAYQSPGAADLHPMDGALNLPREMFSHGIRRMVAKEAARASFDEVVEIVRDYTGATIAKRQVEELAVRAAQDFEMFYEQKAAARDSKDDLLVISTDGKGIVMRHEDLREHTQKAAERRPHRLATRLTSGEKRARKRMAQVATVYSVAPFVRSATDLLNPLRDRTEVEAKRPRPYGQARLGERGEAAPHGDPRSLRRGVATRSDEGSAVGSARRWRPDPAAGREERGTTDRRHGHDPHRSRARPRIHLERSARAVWREQPEGRELGGRSTPGAPDGPHGRRRREDDPLVGRSQQEAHTRGPTGDQGLLSLSRGSCPNAPLCTIKTPSAMGSRSPPA